MGSLPAAPGDAHDQHEAQARELVVGQPDVRPAELVEDLFERIGVDRRAEAVADADRPDRDPGLLAPGVDRQMRTELLREQVRRFGPDVGQPAAQPDPDPRPRESEIRRRATRAAGPRAASRRSPRSHAASRPAFRAEGSPGAPRGASTCRRAGGWRRRSPAGAPRSVATAAPRGPRPGFRAGSIPRPTAVGRA